MFYSALTFEDRQKLVKEFNQSRNLCMVLICSLLVSTHGINLQHLYLTCYFFDIPQTESNWDQAIGQLQHLGQMNIVKVYELRVEKSFNTRQISNLLDKALAGVISLLNPAIFKLKIENNEDLDLRRWVIRDGVLTGLNPDEKPQESDI
jgi:SNF2 family DNA or RNA helicase